MKNYANPSNFLRLTGVLTPWLAALTAALLCVGLYLVWFVAPPDYQQGETVRIMYLHVPAAWLSMWIYIVMTSAALGTLVWRHPLADAAQKPPRRSAPASPSSVSSPDRSGASPCGAPGGSGTRASPPCWCCF